MRKHLVVILIFVGAFAPRGVTQRASCPGGQEGKALTHARASIFLIADRTRYALHQSLVIDAGIRNDGPDPLYVYGQIAWGYGGGLVLRLRNQSGKEIAPVLRDDTMLPPPPKDDDPSMFVALEENTFFGTRRELPVTKLVKTPGRYSLQVEYRSPLACGFVDPKLEQLPALWHEDESIFSNSVSFEVIR